MPEVPWWLFGLLLAHTACAWVLVWNQTIRYRTGRAAAAVPVEPARPDSPADDSPSYDELTWAEAEAVLTPDNEYRGYET